MTLQEIADELLAAQQQAFSIEPIRSRITTLDQAYEIQRLLMSQRLSPDNLLVGRKVGLTSKAVQQQLGVDQPDFGLLLADMEVADGGILRMAELVQPKAEAEIAFVLAEDVLSDDFESLKQAVAYAVAALEIVDSRIHRWEISLFDTVADNASSALFVLGPVQKTLDEFSPKDAVMELYQGGEKVSSGRGEDCLGDPLLALHWVAKTALAQGEPLRAGQVVLSGALGPMVTLQPGAEYRALISGLGEVSVNVEEGS